MSRKRIVIVGAGPIGIEAALKAHSLGHEPRVLEATEVGGHLARWGHVKLFSPFELNHSELGARSLQELGHSLPHGKEYLTGEEHRDRYLLPLSRLPALASRIEERTRVVGIGREGIGKNDLIGGPRERYPFRILCERDGGEELLFEADQVIDCSGTYRNHNWLGNGNLPARGERGLSGRIRYQIADILGSDRSDYHGKRVLLVGSGHSAAAALEALEKLPARSVHWVARTSTTEPLTVIPDDPLPERQRLSALANRLAAGASERVRFHGGTAVESLREIEGGIEVELSRSGGIETLVVDRILALVGYHPDNSIYRELQVHECYASFAPMKLGAALLGDRSSDCLAQTSKGAASLTNPEPGFFILGAKSYGKNPNFLIRIGLAQIEEVFGLIGAAVDDAAKAVS